MDDRIAMEGTIAYCNQRPEEAANNIECANARRAQATIALRAERDRREAFERESEQKLEALRAEMAERERLVRETMIAAAAAERQAYENLWRPGPEAATAAGHEAGLVGPQLPPDRLNQIELPPTPRQGE